jgi:hypothetical protein
MPKVSGSPRFVLVYSQAGVVSVTASEGYGKAEYRRLFKRARTIVQQSTWDSTKDWVQIFMVMEPEGLSSGGLLTDLQIHEWRPKTP